MAEKERKEIEGKEKKRKQKERGLMSVREKNYNFMATKSEIKSALLLHQPLILLMYKEAFMTTNELAESLPSNVVSLLREFEDVFPE